MVFAGIFMTALCIVINAVLFQPLKIFLYNCVIFVLISAALLARSLLQKSIFLMPMGRFIWIDKGYISFTLPV